MFDMIGQALPQVFTIQNLLFINIGMLIGIIFGAIPGLNGNLAITVLLPFTFSFEPIPGILMLTSIFFGANFGGSISAILINTPGTGNAAATVLDGYPLALPARYANRQACYTTVYIISNIDLSQQYKNVQETEPATWKAFLRRIHHVVEQNRDKPPTDHGPALDYIFPPPKPTPDWVREIENDETPPEQFGLPF